MDDVCNEDDEAFFPWTVISCTGRSKVRGLPGFCLPSSVGMLDEIAVNRRQDREVAENCAMSDWDHNINCQYPHDLGNILQTQATVRQLGLKLRLRKKLNSW